MSPYFLALIYLISLLGVLLAAIWVLDKVLRLWVRWDRVLFVTALILAIGLLIILINILVYGMK